MGEHASRGLVIGISMHCRGCGYELRGLPSEGCCPECGLEVIESLRHAIDPAASRLPKLRNPQKVGNALVWLLICQLVGTVVFLIAPGSLRLWASLGWSLVHYVPTFLPMVAAIVALAGLWSVWAFRSPGGQDGGSTPRDLRWIAVGHTLWALCAVLFWKYDSYGSGWVWWWVSLSLRVGLALAGVIAYSGLKGVLNTIGRRSRVFRTSKGGRQRVRDLSAALLGVMVGEILKFGGGAIESEELTLIGTMVSAICLAMLVIGQCYLVVNGWWVRRALRKPPPTLDEALVRSVHAPDSPFHENAGAADDTENP